MSDTDKFFKVTIVLTAKEYATLRHEAALLGPRHGQCCHT